MVDAVHYIFHTNVEWWFLFNAHLDVSRGNLMTRSLVDLVKKEHFVLNSEYLITLMVVVPK